MANIRNFSNIEQRFYHYEKWEDYQSGMYNPPSAANINDGETSDSRIQKAIDCLSNPDICRKYMEMVVNQWEISTQQVLTSPDMNPKAWLGQCACFMYGGCHDEETRKAWCLMNAKDQREANKIADEVIFDWLQNFSRQCPNYQLTLFDVGVEAI